MLEAVYNYQPMVRAKNYKPRKVIKDRRIDSSRPPKVKGRWCKARLLWIEQNLPYKLFHVEFLDCYEPNLPDEKGKFVKKFPRRAAVLEKDIEFLIPRTEAVYQRWVHWIASSCFERRFHNTSRRDNMTLSDYADVIERNALEDINSMIVTCATYFERDYKNVHHDVTEVLASLSLKKEAA